MTKAGFCSETYSPSVVWRSITVPASDAFSSYGVRLWLLSTIASTSPFSTRIADPLAHLAHDAGKARRDLHQRFLVGLDHAVQQQAIAQHRGAAVASSMPAAATLASLSDHAVRMLFLLRLFAVVGRFGASPASASDNRHSTERSSNQTKTRYRTIRDHHRELSRASENGLPTRPSMVATAMWKFCSASCSRSRACATIAWASSTSSSVKRPWP